MKLLLLNYEFPPMGGGAGNATYNIAAQLVRMGHSVDVLTSRFGDQLSEESVRGIRVHRVSSFRRSIHDCGFIGAASYLFFAFFKLRRLVSENHYDLLHYFFSLPTGLLSLYSHGVRTLPYIVSLRGSDVPGYDPTALRLQSLHTMLKPLTRRIWRNAVFTIALSDGLKRLAHQASPDQPIEIIHNGIDPEIFRPDENGIPGPDGRIRIITVARLIERKGLDVLLEAVSRIRHPDISLRIIGTGQIESKLRELARELKIDGKVEFHGYRNQSDLCKLYNDADLFVLPSMAESFGMVILEAMSCGLPVVATRVGGIPEVVTNGENGLLVQPGDVESLIAGIKTLSTDPVLRDRFSKNNISKVRRCFAWAHIAMKYEEIYEGSLGGNPRWVGGPQR
jgi:glycosyltransferase involved in cell wall biosynthesis